jgi:hypothetical protein
MTAWPRFVELLDPAEVAGDRGCRVEHPTHRRRAVVAWARKLTSRLAGGDKGSQESSSGMPERDDSPTIDTASPGVFGLDAERGVADRRRYDESEPDALPAPSWSR